MLSTRDSRTIERLRLDESDARSTVVVKVPAFERDVHDVSSLARVGEALVGLPLG